jgi:methionyl-tRNA formyltransferase
MLKVHIATNYPTGEECREWLKKHLPPSWEYTDDKDKCDVYLSVLSKEIIKKDFIDKRTCFNFHLGILPEWKGSGIIPQVIVKGETEFGITLHILDEFLDHGNIIDIRKMWILPDDTGEILFERACIVLKDFFQKWAIKLLMRNYWSMPQEFQPKIYTHKDMEKLKDLTPIIRAFTFKDKENAYWINSKGIKIFIKYE